MREAKGEGGTGMKKVIHTEKAPRAVGPYSQAIQAGNSSLQPGRLGLIRPPASWWGEVKNGAPSDGELEGCTGTREHHFSRVVKTTVFLKEMNDFMHFNEVYGEFPVRTAGPEHLSSCCLAPWRHH